ncbi:putative glycosyltransferase, partial [Mucuna pruriens]
MSEVGGERRRTTVASEASRASCVSSFTSITFCNCWEVDSVGSMARKPDEETNPRQNGGGGGGGLKGWHWHSRDLRLHWNTWQAAEESSCWSKEAISICFFQLLRHESDPCAPMRERGVRTVFRHLLVPPRFKMNFEEMEKNFKTSRKLTRKYASEGYFFQNIPESHFRTQDPSKAHLFFIPISCHKMRGKGTSYENMTVIVQNYVESLISKYPYWNRTLGADHFFVTCHDVGVSATEGVELLVKNSIRAIYGSSSSATSICSSCCWNDIENRTNLGFWAGHRISKIRVILARVWENETELNISNNRSSRAVGHLIYQKRVNYYDLPFNDILDWNKFAVVLKESDVYQLKQILKNMSYDEFVALHNNLVQVQKHFQWNSPPNRFDFDSCL